MISDFMRELEQVLRYEMESLAKSTGVGCAQDWADYKYRVGIVTGYTRALEKATDLYQKYLNDED